MPGSRLASNSLATMVMRPRYFVLLGNSNEHDRGSVDGHPCRAIQTGTRASGGLMAMNLMEYADRDAFVSSGTQIFLLPLHEFLGAIHGPQQLRRGLQLLKLLQRCPLFQAL